MSARLEHFDIERRFQYPRSNLPFRAWGTICDHPASLDKNPSIRTVFCSTELRRVRIFDSLLEPQPSVLADSAPTSMEEIS